MREGLSWSRYSAPHQEMGDSLQRQKEAYERVCERYKDRCEPSARYGFGTFSGRGQSGYHGAHLRAGGGLRALLDRMQSGEIDPHKVVLVIEAFDRLGRLAPDLAINLLSDIVRSGCPIAVYSPDLWVDVATLESWAFSQIALCVQLAHAESAQKAERARRSWQHRREKRGSRPPTTKCPAWLAWDGTRWQEVPDKANVVRRIFGMVIDGFALRRIATVLNAESIPTFTTRGARRWGVNGLRHLVRNRACIGEAQPGIYAHKDGARRYKKTGETWISYYPAVVTPETFVRAQGCLDQRRRLQGRPEASGVNLFRGLAHDARTKSHMVLHTQRVKGKVYRYLAPYAQLTGGGPVYSVPYDAFEAGFLYYVRGPKVTAPRPNAYKADIEREEELIRQLDARMDALNVLGNLDELVALTTKIAIAKREAEARLRELEKKAAAQSPAEALDECAAFTRLYEEHAAAGTLDQFSERLRSKIRAFVSEIWCLTVRLPKRASATVVQVFLRDGSTSYFGVETRMKQPWRIMDDVSEHIDATRDLRLWKP